MRSSGLGSNIAYCFELYSSSRNILLRPRISYTSCYSLEGFCFCFCSSSFLLLWLLWLISVWTRAVDLVRWLGTAILSRFCLGFVNSRVEFVLLN
jgi:hypothetical protein